MGRWNDVWQPVPRAAGRKQAFLNWRGNLQVIQE